MPPPDARSIYVLNGPNLNLLGTREPKLYGRKTLEDLDKLCAARAQALGFGCIFKQSNAEHVLVESIHEAALEGAGLVINPAAFSYSSYAMVDALKACEIPAVEVHLTNIHAREEGWRSKSLVSPAVRGVISGLGFEGYALAIAFIAAEAADRR
jgi:3-dehydroquinate dehydratase-2